MHKIKPIVAAVLIAVLSLGSIALGQDGAIEAGDLATYTFHKPLVNGLGVDSLDDLKGKPVLVEFFGHRCPPCISTAVPGSLRLAEEFGDDLAVIFVESQGLAIDEVESFTYGRKWMGTNAMWTTERPFQTGARGLPNFVLLSIEGEVLLKGNPISMENQIEDAIKKEIARSRRAPEGTPSSLARAWKDFGKGKYANAFAAARKVLEAGGEDAGAAEAALSAFENRLASRVDRAAWMIENGHYLEADELVSSLAKSFKGLEAFESRVKDLSSRLSSPELKDELEAARSLARIMKRVLSDGLDPRTVKLLQSFSDREQGTRAAEHASRLAALADAN